MVQQVAINQLQEFAALFWKYADEANVFAFHGQMGAGKTTIIAALCRYKGVQEPVSSPTFSIINQYGYAENDRIKTIYHIDLYRLKGSEEIFQAGVEDCLYSGAVCLVEWPEKAPELFDTDTVHIYVEPENERVRTVTIEKAGVPHHSIV